MYVFSVWLYVKWYISTQVCFLKHYNERTMNNYGNTYFPTDFCDIFISFLKVASVQLLKRVM